MTISYAGKTTHSGAPAILLVMTSWAVPARPGDKGRHVIERLVAPRDQCWIQAHPRHITAYREDGERCCISPSCKGFGDVAKRFRWGASGTKGGDHEG